MTLAAAAVCLTGCYKHVEVRDIDARALEGTIEWARVTTRDRADFPVRNVTLRADSIVGEAAGVRLALARADIVRIRERRPDGVQMVIAAAGLGAIGYMVLARPGHD